MLQNIAVKSAEMLKKRDIIASEKEKIYIYGFELLYSFLFCVGTMLVCGLVLGCVIQVVVFLLYFIPIRIVAGGYHAKTYSSCFFLSNMVTLISVKAVELLWKVRSFSVELVFWGVFIWGVVYIAKQAPVVSRNVLIKKEVLSRNQAIEIKLLILEIIVLIVVRIGFNNGLSYVGMIAICVVAFMIRITKGVGMKL